MNPISEITDGIDKINLHCDNFTDQKKAIADSLEWIDELNLEIYITEGMNKDEMEEVRLEDTHLICSLNSYTSWEARKSFLKEVLTDIISSKCPRDEPFVLISFGSHGLLMEYILGKGLIENGFHNIFFRLVDPVYKFSDPADHPDIELVLKGFNKSIENIYFNVCKEPLPKGTIQYLSRAQKVCNYVDEGSNVVVIESLPPYAIPIKKMKFYKAPEKKPEDLICGNFLVPKSQANSIAFFPSQIAAQLTKQSKFPEYSILPIYYLGLLENEEPFCCFDWGCKIESDGSYHMSFSGEKDYTEYMKSKHEISGEQSVLLERSLFVEMDQWVTAIRGVIEFRLINKIKELKAGDPSKKLSQEDITTLLTLVEEVFNSKMPSSTFFYMADYFLDSKEALSLLSSKAGHHYRKSFLFAYGSTTVKELP